MRNIPWREKRRNRKMVLCKKMGKYLSVLVMGGVLLASGMLFSRTSLAQGKSFTGVVSDTMCGAKHKMADAAKCTLGCTGHGAGFALVVGDKVYKLEGKTEGLDKLAGAKAKVTGTAAGDTITVQSVEAAS
jgi:hypothetical protein